VKLVYGVEIQPTQWQALLRDAGNARWAYSGGLQRKLEAWETRQAALAVGARPEAALRIATASDLHRELHLLKKKPPEPGGVPWMHPASKGAPQAVRSTPDSTSDGGFRQVRAGETPGFPRFTARHRGSGGFTSSMRAVAGESFAAGRGCMGARSWPATRLRLAGGAPPMGTSLQTGGCRSRYCGVGPAGMGRSPTSMQAVNILVAMSYPETLDACGADVRCSGQSAMKQESAVAS